MIIKKADNITYEINELFLDSDWYNDGNYIIDETTTEGKTLKQKVIELYPNFIVEVDENNFVIDVQEDIEKINEQKLNYTVVEYKPSDIEIQFAEYILATEDRITNLENQLGGM